MSKLPTPTYIRVTAGHREEIYTFRNGWGASVCRYMVLPPMNLDEWSLGILIKLSSKGDASDWYLTSRNPFQNSVICPRPMTEIQGLLKDIRGWEKPHPEVIYAETKHYLKQEVEGKTLSPEEIDKINKEGNEKYPKASFADLKVPDPPKDLPPGQYIVDGEGNYHPVPKPGDLAKKFLEEIKNKYGSSGSFSVDKESLNPPKEEVQEIEFLGKKIKVSGTKSNDPLYIINSFVQSFFGAEVAIQYVDSHRFNRFIKELRKTIKHFERNRDAALSYMPLRKREHVHSMYTQRIETYKTLIDLIERMFNLYITFKEMEGVNFLTTANTQTITEFK